MARVVFGGCMSHSPLMNFPTPVEQQAQVRRVNAAILRFGAAIHASRPDVIIVFGQDHFRSFFYDNMPAFCIGVGDVKGWADFDTPAGPFATAKGLSRQLARSVLDDGFDPSVSYDLKVDHGISLPLQKLGLESASIVPILINTSAPPLPRPSRCYEFGCAVARAVTRWPDDVRVAVIGSGGLSHAPPGVDVESTDPADRERIDQAIHGHATVEARAASREAQSLANHLQFVKGIHPDWDRTILAAFERGTVASLAEELNGQNIEAEGGRGGHEIRTWLAAAGALGHTTFDILAYEPVTSYITGMGVVLARHMHLTDQLELPADLR